MKNLTGEVGLDVACGFMENKRFFRTDRYVGLDADAARIESGLQKYPDAEGQALRIEDLSEDHAADVVLCVQTIGTNTLFEQSGALEAVQKLMAATKPGGTLIFNVGQKCSQNGIEFLICSEFRDVEIRRYGSRMREYLPPIAFILARLMQLRLIPRGGAKMYLVCRDKLASTPERTTPAP